jgi:two-component system, chemotaxis family, sensor kinase Cph1
MRDIMKKNVQLEDIKNEHVLNDCVCRSSSPDVSQKYHELEMENKQLRKSLNALQNTNESLIKRIKNNELSDKRQRAYEQSELSRSEEFAKVLDAVPAAVWISHDSQGRLITGNQLSYDYLNIPYGANASKSTPPPLRPETFKIFKDGIEVKTEDMPVQLSSKGKEIRNYEFDFVYLDNTVRHMMGNATPLYDENKNPRGSVSAFIDITKHKIAEIKMKELVNITSHDLKEPLRMITLFTQLLYKRYKSKLDQDADEFIDYIVEGTNRMQHLLDDLLEYSRITTEVKKYERVNLNEILQECIDNLKLSINESKATIDHDKLPEVVAIRTHMVQLFQNLLSNAIKFQSKKTPKIMISVREDRDKYIFAVKDNGIGINVKYQSRIFKVFHRLHTSDEYDGTGIGLSITKKIVQQHNGKIWVKSEFGQGSTFYFTLPLNE